MIERIWKKIISYQNIQRSKNPLKRFSCFVYFSRVLLLQSGVKAVTEERKKLYLKVEETFPFYFIIKRKNLKWALSQQRNFLLHHNNELALLMTASIVLCIGEDFRRYHRRLLSFLFFFCRQFNYARLEHYKHRIHGWTKHYGTFRRNSRAIGSLPSFNIYSRNRKKIWKMNFLLFVSTFPIRKKLLAREGKKYISFFLFCTRRMFLMSYTCLLRL